MGRLAACAHLFGDCNPLSDAVSRSLWERFFALCASINVRPTQIDTPPALIAMIERVVQDAASRGEPIRIPDYHRPPPVLPRAMLALGRRTSACEEADAVNVSAKLFERLSKAPTQPEPPTVASSTRPARPTISAKLASRLSASVEPSAASSAAPLVLSLIHI